MKDEKCGIYCIENVLDGKKYIGLTTRKFSKRWAEHKYRANHNIHRNPFFQKAWNKYGEDSFIFWIVETCDKDSLSEKEQYYISFLSTMAPHGYNLTSGGERTTYSSLKKKTGLSGEKNPRYGKKNSEETRKKISIANKGRILTEETKKNMSIATKGTSRRRGCPSKNNISGFVGISWIENSQSWQSSLRVNGKLLYLGAYEKPDEAALARDKKAIELFGYNTKLNFDLKYVLLSDAPIRKQEKRQNSKK